MGTPVTDGGYRVLNAREIRRHIKDFEVRKGTHCSKEKWKAMQNHRKIILPTP